MRKVIESVAPLSLFVVALLACKASGDAGSKCGGDQDCKNGLSCQGGACRIKPEAEPPRSTAPTPGESPQTRGAPLTLTPLAPQPQVAVAPNGPAEDARNTVPDPWTYPETGFVALTSACTDPYVVVATLPPTAPDNYDYYYTRFMLAAFPSFTESSAPASPRQLAFREVMRNESRSLVAKTADYETANKFTASYRKAVAGSTPQPVCGAAVSGWNSLNRQMSLTQGERLPPTGDSQPAVQQQCARLGVCMALLRPDPGHNPGVDCLRKPTQFERLCTRKRTCGEVVTCLGK